MFQAYQAVQVTDQASAHLGKVGKVLASPEKKPVTVKLDDGGEVVDFKANQLRGL
jgi:hypothetical protein